MELSEILIGEIPAKKAEKFFDPFHYVEPTQDGAEEEAEKVQEPEQSVKDDELSYLLGKNRCKDTEEGDAGCILQKAMLFPTVNFVRSQYCGRHKNNNRHSDVPSGASNKKMRSYLVTTGLSVAYLGTNEVCIYSIQAPTKDTVPNDYSTDYYTRIMNARKTLSKKSGSKGGE